MIKVGIRKIKQRILTSWKTILWIIILYLIILYSFDKYNTVYQTKSNILSESRTITLTDQNGNVISVGEYSEDYVLRNTYNDLDFSVLPIPKLPYLKNYRNPCWLEKDSHSDVEARLRCLPYFYLAGVEKCGTTGLYYSITKHEMIWGPREKEPHYWGKGRYQPKGNFTKYLNMYSNVSLIIERRSIGVKYHPYIAIDGSADTFLNNFMWRQFGNELQNDDRAREILSPYQIKHLTPDAKFVIIVRNPVDRLYSSYNYFPLYSKLLGKYNMGFKQIREKLLASKCPEDFHNKVVEALDWISTCSKSNSNFSKKCLFWNEGISELDNFVNHVQMGLYGLQMFEWLKAFPIENFKFVRLEDVTVDKRKVLNEILSFLQLSPVSASMQQKIDFLPEKMKNTGNATLPMLSKTRKILDEFYSPFNKILAGLLNDSKFLYD